jgi:hypothetical protein
MGNPRKQRFVPKDNAKKANAKGSNKAFKESRMT